MQEIAFLWTICIFSVFNAIGKHGLRYFFYNASESHKLHCPKRLTSEIIQYKKSGTL